MERQNRTRRALSPLPQADQSNARDTAFTGDVSDSGTERARPAEVVAPAARGEPAAGPSGAPEDTEASGPAHGRVPEMPAILAALVAVAIGVLVLLGWVSGLRALSAFLPGALPMKANAALLLLLLGAALAVRATSRRPRLVGALALVALAVAFATALEYATGVDLGIDRLLASDVARSGAPYPGRMALGAVIGFGAGGLALLMLGRTWRGWHLSAFLALIVAVIGGLGVLGYAYGANELTSIGSVTQIAFPAALGFVVLTAGLIAADPQHGLMRLLRDPGLAGQLTRRLLPMAMLVVPIGGWLRLELTQAGVFDQQVGTALWVIFEILVLGALGAWTIEGALRVERSRVEAQRERDRVLETSEDLMCATDAEGRLTLVSPSWTRHLGYDPGELLGHTIAEFVHPDDLGPAGEAFLAGAQHANGVRSLVSRGRARDGTYRWLEWNSTRDPETGQVYAVARDVSERKVAELALQALNAELEERVERRTAALEQAHLDDLTGLYRREMGTLALTNEIDRARRGDGRFVVAFVDVDGLKRVNDRDGHAAGDHVLRTLAAAIGPISGPSTRLERCGQV